jgi:IS5 family transposase
MYRPSKQEQQKSLFFSLSDTLDPNHELYRLAKRINWQRFEEEFSKLYSPNQGRPTKPIRLMVGLIILRHYRNISDDQIVLQWTENAYYQYFCGMEEFSTQRPCDSSEMTVFRKLIGEKGVQLILKESIRVNDDHDDEASKTVYVDSTVQEKNVTFPTDAKLLKKIVGKCNKISQKEGLPRRQSYSRILKRIYLDQRFRSHPKNNKKAVKADRRLRTIAGRLVREVDRNLNIKGIGGYEDLLALFYRVLSQRKNTKGKIYSLHEPEEECICKGKEHKKYEFGNKVSIARTEGGLITAAVSFRNENDSKTLDGTIEQIQENTGKLPKQAACDRGYRGRSEVHGVNIVIPGTPKKSDTYWQRKKKHKLFCNRAAIEPTIGHIKSDCRMWRNFLKGTVGDSINIMLSAAAFNFRRAARLLLRLFWECFENCMKALFAIPKLSMLQCMA